MTFDVWLTDDAARDLDDLFHFIAGSRGADEAGFVLDHLGQVLSPLRESPERGTFPKELLPLGIHEYREVFFKPYRVVYRVADHDVFVLLIADGRRDFETLLQRRLLEP
jgi:toxin ParE1/3/4